MKSLFVLLLAFAGMLYTLESTAASANRQRTAEESAPVGGIVTLWCLDGIANTLSLNDGLPGGMQLGHTAHNRDSQLDFGTYNSRRFTVGIQGGEDGRIVDLGSEEELRERYGYTDTVPQKQGFASIHRRGEQIVIRSGTDNDHGQVCVEAMDVFEEKKGGHHAAVRLDHIYLVRITDRHDETYEQLTKLHVIGHHRDQSVTLRWERL